VCADGLARGHPRATVAGEPSAAAAFGVSVSK
jgi:hypothetical protein